MKQIKNLAWMSAIALAGTITFAACSSDDDKVQNINPTYDGKSVKTQFAINIPRAAQQTRQTAEITQINSSFRGMQDIKLVPMTEGGSVNTNIENLIELSAIDENNGLENSIKIYNDVDIAIGTTNFLFYGKAPKNENASNAAYGKLTSDFSATTAANISFSLEPIHPGTLTDASLLGILNGIVGIEDWQSSSNVSLRTALTNIEGLTVGSSKAILRAVEKLYNVVKASNESVANTIISKIETYFDVEGSSNPYTLKYKNSYMGTNDQPVTINTSFPTDLGLPEGAARLICEDHVFSYATATAIGDASIATNTITYPAELYYFANTPLKANTSADANFDWAIGTWTDWGDEVQATTRLIALKNKINYGVALLTTNVKLENNATTLKDNKGEIVTVTGNNLNLKFTGILIGGQPAKVGWDFNPTTNETFAQTIYDNTMNSTDALSTTNVTNYTMVLDNYGSKGTADNTSNTPNNSVNIAIELENNTGSEFQGVDGVVANGAKFYLVAKLDPTDDDTNVDRVFLQDYTTTANLTITSLKNAYVTIPDLRATQLNLGLYVDLSWETGLTFDVNIGGDNQ